MFVINSDGSGHLQSNPCTPAMGAWSSGSGHWPFTPGIAGSNPVAPTLPRDLPDCSVAGGGRFGLEPRVVAAARGGEDQEGGDHAGPVGGHEHHDQPGHSTGDR